MIFFRVGCSCLNRNKRPYATHTACRQRAIFGRLLLENFGERFGDLVLVVSELLVIEALDELEQLFVAERLFQHAPARGAQKFLSTLREGSELQLTQEQLTLKGSRHTLVYQLADWIN